MKWDVEVTRKIYRTGTISIEASSEKQAEDIVIDHLDRDMLDESKIEWGEPDEESITVELGMVEPGDSSESP